METECLNCFYQISRKTIYEIMGQDFIVGTDLISCSHSYKLLTIEFHNIIPKVRLKNNHANYLHWYICLFSNSNTCVTFTNERLKSAHDKQRLKHIRLRYQLHIDLIRLVTFWQPHWWVWLSLLHYDVLHACMYIGMNERNIVTTEKNWNVIPRNTSVIVDGMDQSKMNLLIKCLRRYCLWHYTV